ncbi:MAG: site-specific integrase [Fuerstiella sp.]
MKKRKRKRAGPVAPFYSKYHKRWLVRYWVTGKRHERKFRDQAAASEFATSQHNDQQDGIDHKNMTLGDLVRKFLATKADKSRSTVADYTTTLNHAKGLFRVPLHVIGNSEIDELILTRPSPAAQKRLQRTLSMVFRRGVRWKLIRINPCDGAEKQTHKPEKAEVFELDEVTAILNARKDHRLIGLFDLGFTLGPRPEELFGFQWQDWNESKQTLTVVRKVAEVHGHLDIGPPKTPAALRDLILPNHITARLIDRRKAAMKEGRASRRDWIWPDTRGGPLRRSNLRQKVWQPALAAAEVRYRKLYCMRHTAASTMLNGCDGVRGISLAVVSETLGHENSQVTLERYSHTMKAEHQQVAAFWNATERTG